MPVVASTSRLEAFSDSVIAVSLVFYVAVIPGASTAAEAGPIPHERSPNHKTS